jgi:capsule biosynthesis phosphatase
MSVNYVLCAAGEGSRFQKDFNKPKPLIKIHGKTFLEWGLQSLPIFQDDKILIITQKKHRIREQFLDTIQAQYPFNSVEWIELHELTKGQLETALAAEAYLDGEASTVIYNADTYFQSRSLLALMEDPSLEGIVPCSEEEGEAWSFCLPDANDHIQQIREKERISGWATVGFYYFRDTRKFVNRARAALACPNEKEYYVAPLYQTYIDAGETVAMDRVSLFKPMGTPDQLQTYWGLSLDIVKTDNAKKVIVVDIDNTITIEDPRDPYPEKKPNMALIQKMREYKAKGFEIILHSARRMRTHKNDESKVLAGVGQITMSWLKKHDVPYDGIKFGRPFAQNGFYVDDKTVRPLDFVTKSEEEILAMIKKENDFFRSGGKKKKQESRLPLGV